MSKGHEYYRDWWKRKVDEEYGRGAYYESVGSLNEEDYVRNGQLALNDCLTSGLKENDRVLDFGCGNGRLAVHLKNFLKGEYWGIDINGRLIEDAKRKVAAPNFHFAVNESPRLWFPDRYFDFICAFSVITHLDIEYASELFREWKRLLRSSDNLLVTFIKNDGIPSFSGDVSKMEHNGSFLIGLSYGAGFQFLKIREGNVGQWILHLSK